MLCQKSESESVHRPNRDSDSGIIQVLESGVEGAGEAEGEREEGRRRK